MKYRYLRHLPPCSTQEIDRETFDKMLFNETILEVRHKSINQNNDMLIYQVLKYDIIDDSTEIFYLIADRII